MRKMHVLLALAVLTVANTGCSSCFRSCRNLFRRGAPCGGTTLVSQPMLGGAIPLGNPVSLPQMVPQNIIAQPGPCCEQAPICCEPCPTECVPCETGGYIGGTTGYVGEGDCGCQTAPGEYFGGYEEGSGPPPITSGGVVPGGSSTPPYPGPAQ